MAQRRMFSLKVVDTDSFLDMSPTAQNLYFHLGMRADDDGFIANPRRIQKMIGAPEDDLKILYAKNFIIPMATNGICVVTHWKTNNLIKGDRYTPTLYLEEKGRLVEENGVYKVDMMGSRMVPEVEPQDRLGKDSIPSELEDEIRVVQDSSSFEENERPRKPAKYPNARTVFSWFPNPQQSWKIDTAQNKYAELLFLRGESKVRSILKYLKEHQEDDFCPQVTKPSDLEKKWEDIVAYANKN